MARSYKKSAKILAIGLSYPDRDWLVQRHPDGYHGRWVYNRRTDELNSNSYVIKPSSDKGSAIQVQDNEMEPFTLEVSLTGGVADHNRHASLNPGAIHGEVVVIMGEDVNGVKDEEAEVFDGLKDKDFEKPELPPLNSGE